MPGATGVRSRFASPPHPHEPKEGLVHTPERKVSTKGASSAAKKNDSFFFHTVTAADLKGPSGQCDMQLPFSYHHLEDFEKV